MFARKMISPAGVALILICLFFPFVGVACESSVGKVEAEISGWDMVVGGKPSVSATGLFDGQTLNPAEVDDELSDATGDDNMPVQPLMVVFVVALLLVAVFTMMIRTVITRVLAGLVATGFAVLALVANQIVVMEELADEVSEESTGGGFRLDGAELVGSRFGFWLTLLFTIALLAYGVLTLLHDRRRGTPPPWPQSPGMWPPPQDPTSPPPTND